MANHYEVPVWAGKAPTGHHLDVTKDDKLIQKLMIDEKKCYLFGRNKQLNDFCIDHGSCSRVHAALVYHKNLNISYLVDLGSSKWTSSFFMPSLNAILMFITFHFQHTAPSSVRCVSKRISQQSYSWTRHFILALQLDTTYFGSVRRPVQDRPTSWKTYRWMIRARAHYWDCQRVKLI